MAPDALTVAVVWGRLVAIAEEMATALANTSYSEQVQSGDFSNAVFDTRGRLVAQANRSPAHLGSMPHAVEHMLSYYPPESLQDGDVLIMNDPHLGAGHLPDVFGLSPVHADGELVGFVCGSIHVTDVGGMLPGSQAVVGVTELVQEGLRLLPVPLFRAGEPVDEVVRIIEANVRVPDLVLGDLRALRSALFVGSRKLAELMLRYGRETVERCVDTFLDSSEQAVRTEIATIPDGTYCFVDHLDDIGPDTDPVRLECAVTVEGTEIDFDFTGTDPETPSGLNSTLSYTRSYCYWVTKAITTKDSIPQNSGQVRPMSVRAPEGSFFNPTQRVAVGGRACLNQKIVEVVFGALAQAIPERVCAASGQWINPIFGGVDPDSGDPFVFYDYILGGVGARAQRDGVDAMSPVFSVESVPLEVQEARNPVIIERFELMADSGGAGRHRGGLSIRKDVRLLADGMTLSNLTDRQRFAPYGLDGGREGALGVTVANPGTEEELKLESKGAYTLKKGDLVSLRCSGSAGFGPPEERPRDAVRSDLRQGLISAHSARDVYGLDESEVAAIARGEA
ncbi:MAG: hydantoinase B/oxoprolinase family protein [Solirubrobacterales bacterium]